MKALPSVKAKAAKPASKQGDGGQGQRFASVFEALADTPQEAANLRARAQLAREINAAIRDNGWTQRVAAETCGVTQPRINDLMNGRISRFSLDALVNIASAVGRVKVALELEHT